MLHLFTVQPNMLTRGGHVHVPSTYCMYTVQCIVYLMLLWSVMVCEYVSCEWVYVTAIVANDLIEHNAHVCVGDTSRQANLAKSYLKSYIRS